MRTLALEGAPFGSGADIKDSLKIAISFYGRGAYYTVEQSKFDWFDSIRSVIYTNFTTNRWKCAISIGTPWFKSWDIMSVNSTGIIPTIFTGDPSTLSWHNWAIKGWKLINGEVYLIGKTWQGKGYGNAGWSYYSRATINTVMKIRGTGAFILAPRVEGNAQTVKLTLWEVILDFLKQKLFLQTKLDKITPMQTPSQPTVADKLPTIIDWANAIKEAEGWTPGSVSVVHNNPGNLGYTTLTASWGAIQGNPKTDGGSFCHFIDYDTGFKALCNFLTLGAKDELRAFHQARTLEKFSEVYGNTGIGYATAIAKTLNVPLSTDVSSFI
jgi:hypothetical protein